MLEDEEVYEKWQSVGAFARIDLTGCEFSEVQTLSTLAVG